MTASVRRWRRGHGVEGLAAAWAQRHTLLMRDQLHIGSRLCWVVAWLLAVVAPAVYLLWPDELTWWIGLGLVMPLGGLAAWREDQKGYGDGYHGTGDGGPWGPPPG